MSQGDRADHVLLLTRGRVKVWRDEDDGKRILLAVRWPNDLLGSRGVLGGGFRTASIEAIDDCETLHISMERFNVLVDRLKLRGVLFQHLAARLQESEDVRADRTALSSRQQVTRFLARLMETARSELGEEAPEIDLGIRQADLVAALGLVRQTVGRELQALRDEGIVGPERGMITIRNPDRLLSRT